ncbi:MAG: LemA family protein [Saprospiraceae bacterium]
MSFSRILTIIVLGLFVLTGFSMCNAYNSAVPMDEKVKKAWADVENQYQRRADLIPNIVNTVKGYANFEKSTLEAVTNARANATRVQINVDELTPENIQRYEQAQQGLQSALSRLLAVAENYPDLKANQNFLDLQAQLEGTENRIAQERRNYNNAVADYNILVRRFPNNIFMGIFGFSPKGNFSSAPGSDKAPEVNFN